MDAGLLILGDDGMPQLNAEAVLEQERQSQASASRQQEPEQIVPNRRQARAFGMNQLEESESAFAENEMND